MTPAGIEPATFRFVAQHLNLLVSAFKIPFFISLRSHLILFTLTEQLSDKYREK